MRFLLGVVFVGAVVAQPREVAYTTMNACPQGGCFAPLFDKGYFVQFKEFHDVPPNGYELWGPDGVLRYHAEIVAPDGTPSRLHFDAAIDTDGTAILPMWYGGYGGNGRLKGSGIVVVDPSGRQVQFIETERWTPEHVCFGPDNSIWASGTEFTALRDTDGWAGRVGQDYQIVRKYSREGKLLGEFLPRSSFPPGLPPADTGWIRAADNRIGVMTYPGNVANHPEWVELDFTGKEIGRWKLGPDVVGDRDHPERTFSLGGVVLTADGRLFAQPYEKSTKGRRVMLFDRSTSSWQPTDAAGSPPEQAFLVGSDANNLAFERRRGGVSVIWIALK